MKEENEVIKEPVKGRFLSIIFLIWFFCSIIGMIILSKINSYYTIMIFGQYFAGFGMLLLFSKEKEKYYGIILLVIGVACITIPFLIMNSDILSVTINWKKTIVLLILVLFIIIGLCLILIPIISIKKLKKVCTISVDAIIVRNDTTLNKGATVYCPTYAFEFNDEIYEVSNNCYSNIGVNEEGTSINLKINPDNPEEFLGSEVVPMVNIILGIFSLLMSGLGLIIFINNM